CCRRLRAAEREDVRGVARGFENTVQLIRIRGKALHVVRFAAQARDDHIVGRGMRLRGEGAEAGREEQRKDAVTPAIRGMRSPWHLCAPHTTPHLRRKSHSLPGRPSKRRKMIGMFQSSRVERTEMPASEYEIFRGRFLRSDGFQYCPPVSDESCWSRRWFCPVWKFSATPSSRWKVRTLRPSCCGAVPGDSAVTSVRYGPGFSAVHSASYSPGWSCDGSISTSASMPCGPTMWAVTCASASG